MKRILTLLFLFSGLYAKSCSCEFAFSEFTPIFLTEYNHILICKPISADTNDHYINYRAIVSKTFWGTKQDTVTITTFLGSGMCGLPLELNETYLIYGTSYESTIFIGICGPSKRLEKKTLFSYLEGVKSDSLMLTINGIYKKYSISYLKDYFTQARQLELKYLEIISETINGNITTKFTNEIESAEITIMDGKLSGLARFNYPNGKEIASGTFTNNAKEGIWTEAIYKSTGLKNYYLVRTGKYIDSKRHGLWKGKMLIGSFKEFELRYGDSLDIDYN
ncbi:MAG: hypothetical protein V4643_01025 [Bacteroidota bacterium]